MSDSGISSEFAFVQSLSDELSKHDLVFPTSLNATMNIRKVLSDPDASVDKIARVIGTEPVVSMQILRLCNSAAFSDGQHRINDLRQATMRLGIAKVRNIAIAVGMKQLTQADTQKAIPQQVERLWTRSVRIAALSSVLARKLSPLDPDAALLAGLLHNIGTFYIINRARTWPELFSNEVVLWQLVDQWHENIGAAILESWDVSENVSTAVQNYRDYERRHHGAPDLTDILAAADQLDRDFDVGCPENIDWENPSATLKALSLDQTKSKELLLNAKDEIALIFQAMA